MDSDTESTASSLDDDSVNHIDWKQISEWCQKVVNFRDSELDALWYERLAEASSLQPRNHDVTTALYIQGLGQIYRSQGSIEDAMTQFRLALESVKQENADPKPEEKDFVEIEILIGECAYDTDRMDQAMGHFKTACDAGDSKQVTKGQLGKLRISLRLRNTYNPVQMLRDMFRGDDEQKMNDLVTAIAREKEEISLMMRILSIAKDDSELLLQILSKIEKTTTRLIPFTKQAMENSATDEQYAEIEAQGVLLFIQGVAAYKFGVSVEVESPTEDALRLWEECRDQLKKVSGQRAYTYRRNATSALAKHWFQDMLYNRPQKENMDRLYAMGKEDSDQEFNDCIGFLVAMYVKNGNIQQAKEILLPQIKQALQILSDDIPGNDHFGFGILHKKLAYYHDYVNSAVA